MQICWSSLRYSLLRTLFLLAADYVVIQLPALLSNTVNITFSSTMGALPDQTPLNPESYQRGGASDSAPSKGLG